jgi:hypothetical protein
MQNVPNQYLILYSNLPTFLVESSAEEVKEQTLVFHSHRPTSKPYFWLTKFPIDLV